ncbi:MAG: hypothetical protein N3F64_06970 [Nitrososphaeria archaeon]|nr:hypothetical protein [Nitrososphaeria archaeon]
MVKKITFLFRDDMYQFLEEKTRSKKISNLINEIIEYFLKRESMFGTMKRVELDDLRDHSDRLWVCNRLLRLDRILYGN